VLRAFGGAHTAIPLAGGTVDDTWRAGDVVVKRVIEPEEAAWCQRVMADLHEDGFRIPAPIAADGEWVVGGWTASSYIDGLTDGHQRLRDVLEASNRFHDALPFPDAEALAVLGARRHRWAIADRVAWCETTVHLDPIAATVLGRMLDGCERDDVSQRLVHGDLEGNVCFDTDGAPVILDFSPYIRSTRYARAIAVVDALLWRGAGPDVVDLVGADAQSRAGVLRRALAFRFVADALGGAITAPITEHFERVLGSLPVTRGDGPSE
jgi:uncharacterized protein (TIGR02569 family)